MKKRFYFGIDVGGTYTKMALVDEKCRILFKDKISSEGFQDKLNFANSIRSSFLAILSNKKISSQQVYGIGIGVPGPVDSDRGIVLSLTNIKGWNNFYLADYLGSFFSAPIFVENDANCMALAESRVGAAKGASFALCMTLGTGVGGGLILNKNIYHGPYFSGGEVGHIPVILKGLECPCGGNGCLERYVGNRAIMARVKKEFKKDIPLEEVSRLAEAGNIKAIKIWQEVGNYIGVAVSAVVNVFNPEVIVVGGGVSAAGDILISSIKETVKKHSMNYLKGKVKIKKAKLGNDAGVLGAALLAMEKI